MHKPRSCIICNRSAALFIYTGYTVGHTYHAASLQIVKHVQIVLMRLREVRLGLGLCRTA